MVTADEFGRSLRGMAALVGRQPDALASFDTSLDGFRRSFAALAFTVPAFVVSLALERRAHGLDVAGTALLDDGRLVAILGIGHVAGFLLLPLAMILVARRFGLGSRYVPFVVASNWLAVFGSLAMALPGALYLMDLETGALTALFGVAFGVILVQAQWFTARVTLGIGGLAAAAVAALDLGLDWGLDAVVRWLAF